MAVQRRMIYLNSHATVLQTKLFSIRQSTAQENKVRAIRSDELKKATNFLEISPQKESFISSVIGTASVVRVPGYRSRGSGFDSRRYQIFSEK
jgi:hypothetical protein